MPPLLGSTLGPYRVLEQIGVGAQFGQRIRKRTTEWRVGHTFVYSFPHSLTER